MLREKKSPTTIRTEAVALAAQAEKVAAQDPILYADLLETSILLKTAAESDTSWSNQDMYNALLDLSYDYDEMGLDHLRAEADQLRQDLRWASFGLPAWDGGY